jgi:D-alanine-D-alanine ligase
MCKRIIRNLGIPTPAFTIIESEADIRKVDLPFPLFVKPIAEGTGKGINDESRIRNQGEFVSVCSGLLIKYAQPILVETFLPGREFTVGIIGTGKDSRVLGVLEILVKKDDEQAEIYSYFNKENYEERVEYRLVDDDIAEKAKRMALAVWRGFGCRDAGRIDLRADAQGLPNVIDINPLAGLHPIHSDLPILCNMVDINYVDLINMIIQSAMKRINHIEELGLKNNQIPLTLIA